MTMIFPNYGVRPRENVSGGIPDKADGLPFSRMHYLMTQVTQKIAGGVVPGWGWETALPYGTAWASKTDEERLAAHDAGWMFTEAIWEDVPWGEDSGLWEMRANSHDDRRIVWQPWPSYTRENLGPKPTWNEVWDLLREANVRDWIYRLPGVQQLVDDSRDSMANSPVALPGLPQLHVGGGMEHMPAMIHAVSASDLAGAEFTPAVLRTADKAGQAPIWTRQAAHVLLGKLTSQTNVAESAYNMVRIQYDRLVAPVLHPAAGLPGNPSNAEVLAAREQALQKVFDFVSPERLGAAFEAAIGALSRLPDDLPTLRGVLIERIEAAAMRRVKEIKGAKTQQGVDVPPACLDMARALEEVSQACAIGIQKIDAAADATATKAAFDAGVATINAVTPLNVPELFDASDAEVAGDVTVTQSTPVKLIAKQPAGKDIAGVVSVAARARVFKPGAFVAVTSEINDSGDFAQLVILLSPPEAEDETLDYDVVVRNLCGPAPRRVVSITRPAGALKPL
ncbi:MAG: hypothetical protein F4X97_02320 [Boseongicola sp. SB0662_bin_57]|nr:hypothetical protein [Boseongicola sp. SB0662_bin_57]